MSRIGIEGSFNIFADAVGEMGVVEIFLVDLGETISSALSWRGLEVVVVAGFDLELDQLVTHKIHDFFGERFAFGRADVDAE